MRSRQHAGFPGTASRDSERPGNHRARRPEEQLRRPIVARRGAPRRTTWEPIDEAVGWANEGTQRRRLGSLRGGGRNTKGSVAKPRVEAKPRCSRPRVPRLLPLRLQPARGRKSRPPPEPRPLPSAPACSAAALPPLGWRHSACNPPGSRRRRRSPQTRPPPRGPASLLVFFWALVRTRCKDLARLFCWRISSCRKSSHGTLGKLTPGLPSTHRWEQLRMWGKSLKWAFLKSNVTYKWQSRDLSSRGLELMNIHKVDRADVCIYETKGVVQGKGLIPKGD